MPRIKVKMTESVRLYNVYLGILQVAIKRECDIAVIRREIVAEAHITNEWLCQIERAGIKGNPRLSAHIAQAIERYFTSQLGYNWRLEIRPISNNPTTLQIPIQMPVTA